MIKAQILKLVEALSSNADPKSGWDQDLPKYAELDLQGPTLVIAKCGNSYVLSYVLHGAVRSMLVSGELSDDEILKATAFFSDPTTGSARNSYNAEHNAEPNAEHNGQHSGQPDIQRNSPLSGIGSRGSRQNLRDPNAPPGFEDEHLMSRPPPGGPSIQFDPDRDINPPGGPHPQLRSFDPLASGSGGGMTPSPFGSSKPPFIRNDPTFPFGADPYGGGAADGNSLGRFGSGPFGGGNLPF